jgi:uncharacterized protein
MDMGEDKYLDIVKEFINLLIENGIDVSEAYLFGSAARGESNKNSDIDLAVVSRAFKGLLFHDIKKISKYRRKVDLRLEIHPFAFNEIKSDPPSFFKHIQKQGIRVH